MLGQVKRSEENLVADRFSFKKTPEEPEYNALLSNTYFGLEYRVVVPTKPDRYVRIGF